MNDDCQHSRGESKREGRYANYFKIGYNAFEFVIDFGQCYDDDEEVILHTRIIISPFYAKRLLEILRESIEQYEQAFGIMQKGDEEVN